MGSPDVRPTGARQVVSVPRAGSKSDPRCVSRQSWSDPLSRPPILPHRGKGLTGVIGDQAVEVVVPALAGSVHLVATSQRALVGHPLHFVQRPVTILTTPNLSATISSLPSAAGPELQRHCLYTEHRAIAFIMSGRLWDTEKPFLLPLDCQIQWLGPGSGDPGRANGINAIALGVGRNRSEMPCCV